MANKKQEGNSVSLQKTRNEKHLNDYLILKEKGIYKDTVRFAYIDTFHVGMEMLLTVYIIEMIVLLTNVGSENGESIIITPFLIFLPFIFAILVALVCIICALQYFQKTAKDYLVEADKAVKADEADEAVKAFDRFIKKHRNKTLWAHVICVILYGLFSFVIAEVLKVTTHVFSKSFVICTTVVGLLLGAFWNWAGYYRHQRILWCRFFPVLRDPNNTEYKEIRKNDIEYNFKYYKRSIVMIIVSLLVLLALFTIVVLKFNNEDNSVSIIGLLNNGYGTLIIPFFSLCIAYVRLCYSISFDHNDNAIICPSLEAVLSEYPNVKESEDNDISIE